MKNIFCMKLFLLLVSIKTIKNSLFSNMFNLFKNFYIEENFLNIFIIAHKDFHNYRYNPVYKIIVNDPSKLHNKYDLEVLFCDENSKLKDLDGAYGEMSKFYQVYNLYKSGKMSSKYVGFNHYRRYFSFLDNIPDLDEIFKENDVILGDIYLMTRRTLRENYCKYHLCQNYDEMIEIIKDIKPEYYKDAIEVSNSYILFTCNTFIMKKEDFFKYCEFMFDILFEFDKRHNFKTEKDMEVYMSKYFQGNESLFQVRAQGFLSERISTIFYHKYFNSSRIKRINIVSGKTKSKVNQTIIDIYKKKYKVTKKIKVFKVINIIVFIALLSISIFFVISRTCKLKYKKIRIKNRLNNKRSKEKYNKVNILFMERKKLLAYK